VRRALLVLVFAGVVAAGAWYAVTRFRQADSAAATDSAAAAPRAPKAITLPALGETCGARCGVQRWPVKTLSDPSRELVNLTPVATTVEELAAIPRPGRFPQLGRNAPVELTTYEVTGCLGIIDRQPEADGDIHLVIGGLRDRRISLIAEVPDPGCEGVCQSGLGYLYATVRATLDSALASGRVSPECNNDVPLIQVTGVGFFDRAHGQRGAAPNYIELHPVLGVTFPD